MSMRSESATDSPIEGRRTRRRRAFSLNGLAIQLSAFALSFTLVALLVVSSSRAAFVDQNENTLNQLTGGEVELSDNDSGTALFTSEDGLAPGETVQRCIRVTYQGNVDPVPVKLYAASTSGALAPYLDLAIEIGPDSGSAFGSCAGFAPTGTVYSGTLAGFGSSATDFASGRTTWDPAGPDETRTFRFSLTLGTDPAASGASASFGFTWEARAT
jgi:hypothetical protein